MEFKVGDKVVPLSKSYGDSFESCEHAQKLKEGQVNFLYVVGIEGELFVLNSNKNSSGLGSYYKEQDLKKFNSKNQRITALENEASDLGKRTKVLEKEVAELKVIVHELRKPSTVITGVDYSTQPDETVITFEGNHYRKVDREAREGDVVVFHEVCTKEDVSANKPYKTLFVEDFSDLRFPSDRMPNAGKAYNFRVYDKQFNRTPETVDVYELIVEDKPSRLAPHVKQYRVKVKTANGLRAEIIEKARQFVDATATDDTHFEIEGNQVLAWRIIRKGKGYDALTGVAVCSPNDVFNEDIGRAIAVGRLEGLDVSEFEQAVQPTGYVQGHEISFHSLNGISETKKITKVDGTKLHFGTPFVRSDRHKTYKDADKPKIINDTNAIYSEVNE